jgi:hypothetical protein
VSLLFLRSSFWSFFLRDLGLMEHLLAAYIRARSVPSLIPDSAKDFEIGHKRDEAKSNPRAPSDEASLKGT